MDWWPKNGWPSELSVAHHSQWLAAAFYHDNFAGSLTKRVLSLATRFEEFADTLMFNVVGNLVPIGFACVILWRYRPWLVATLGVGFTHAGGQPLFTGLDLDVPSGTRIGLVGRYSSAGRTSAGGGGRTCAA